MGRGGGGVVAEGREAGGHGGIGMGGEFGSSWVCLVDLGYGVSIGSGEEQFSQRPSCYVEKDADASKDLIAVSDMKKVLPRSLRLLKYTIDKRKATPHTRV